MLEFIFFNQNFIRISQSLYVTLCTKHHPQMEIELILPMKTFGYVEDLVAAEKNFIKKVMPLADSFFTFAKVNEVFNTQKRKKITRKFRLVKVYKADLTKPFEFVICKN